MRSGGSPQSPNPSTPSNPAPSPNPDPDPAPSQSFDELVSQYESNDEYQDQWGLAAINASSAYARGATGKGIVIGITDSGLDTSHDEIAYSRVLPESNLTYSNYDPTTSQQRHGTMVASVAAGTLSQSNSSSMHGVAFDAEILFTAIQLAEPDDDYDPVDLGDTDTSPGEVNEDFTGMNVSAVYLKSITWRKLTLLTIAMAIRVILLITQNLKLEAPFQKPLKKWHK